MKILLINPNRFQSPPVPPIGLEYVAGYLKENGRRTAILDLCFSDNAINDLETTIKAFRPDMAGFSIRNIDTVLFHTNEFFLDEIKELIDHVKAEHNICTLIGGSGVTTNPEGVLQYLGADIAYVGPAGKKLVDCIDMYNNDRTLKGVFDALNSAIDTYPRLTTSTEYQRYIEAGGIAGFETHRGCSSSCVYCIEANRRVAFKPVRSVVDEIRSFTDNGIDHFHLCDSEFNEDPDYCMELCRDLKKRGIKLSWAVYMKPDLYSRELFNLMKETGVYLITVTVDSFKRDGRYWNDVYAFISSAKASGVKVAVDLLTGFPYETEDILKQSLALFKKIGPDSVNINTYIRLYRSLPIAGMIMSDEKLRGNLLGSVDDPSLVTPVFYNQLNTDRLRELVQGDDLFRIEGPEQGVNYRRID